MLLPFNAEAGTQQVLFAIGSGNLDTATTEYAHLCCGGNTNSWDTVLNDTENVIPTGGTFSDFRFKLTGAPDNGGGVDRYTFTVMHNGSASSITCNIDDTDTECTDLVNTLSVSAGDEVAMRVVPSNSPEWSGVLARWSFKWTPDIDNEMLMMGGNPHDDGSGVIDGNSLGFHGMGYDDPTAIDKSFLAPLSGTLKKLYIEMETAPGSGQDKVFTVGSLTCTIEDTATGCNTGASTTTITSGSTYVLSISDNGTSPANTGHVGVAAVFVPDNQGEFPIALSTDAATHATATEYYPMIDGDGAGHATENNRSINASVGFDILNMRAKLATDPGASSEIYTFTLQDDGADASGTFNCSIDGDDSPNFDCSDTETVTIAADSALSTEVVPTSSPTTGSVLISYTGYIEPTRDRRIF